MNLNKTKMSRTINHPAKAQINCKDNTMAHSVKWLHDYSHSHTWASAQLQRGPRRSIARYVIMQAAALCGCTLGLKEVVGEAFPPSLGLGELTETAAGNGGSSTSESFRSGSGAWAGGIVSTVINCSRPPGWTGFIKPGFCLPIFKQAFPVPIDKKELQSHEFAMDKPQRF